MYGFYKIVKVLGKKFKMIFNSSYKYLFINLPKLQCDLNKAIWEIPK